MPNDPLHDEADVARLRRALALARLWLATFANPKSFVWSEGGEAPHQIASAALAQVTAELTRKAAGAGQPAPVEVALATPAPGQAGARPAPGPLLARPAPGEAGATPAPGQARARPAPGAPPAEPDEAGAARPIASGTGRMPRLSRGRVGFVEYHQGIARQALKLGQVRAARAALRVLRTSDFGDQSRAAGALLDALRDNRASEEDVASAALALIRLTPRPGSGST
ncbi:MAG TPA: hypothetical protein VKZ63_14990 [Kofleriaceae bacterium]|nr:hypothetical protein [Kofleriaceae bacterium]